MSDRLRLTRRVCAVIRASREDSDVSREVVARALGLRLESVANIEYGRRQLTVVDLLLMAPALRVDADVLVRRIVRW